MRYPGTTIGITGSFGKTTVKHILGDVLGQLSTVFFSSGSINTPLGHTRHIRQRLQPAHRYFVAEMGAYEGSIERLCDLIDPNHAIITSIGLAHNERFKGLDVVARKIRIGAVGCDQGRGWSYCHDPWMWLATNLVADISPPEAPDLCVTVR